MYLGAYSMYSFSCNVFPQHNDLVIHPCCIYQSFVPFCGRVAFQLCGYTVICLSIHLLMDIRAVPTLGHLQMKLPWTGMHMPLCEHKFWFPFRKYRGVECLGHMAATYMSNFVRNCPMAFQRDCTVPHPHWQQRGGVRFLHFLANCVVT